MTDCAPRLPRRVLLSLLAACLRSGHSSSADVASIFLVSDKVARLALANYLARFPLSPVMK